MKQILVQLDDQTYKDLNRVAPPAKRTRSEFIRKAIIRALMDVEAERMRRAYEAEPDLEPEFTDWNTLGEYKP